MLKNNTTAEQNFITKLLLRVYFMQTFVVVVVVVLFFFLFLEKWKNFRYFFPILLPSLSTAVHCHEERWIFYG